jgi:xyloglucan:xyloglucosyl transferase
VSKIFTFDQKIRLFFFIFICIIICLQMSNGDMFEKQHDEIDFEFLGNIRGKDWRIQTNIYGNGSTSVGREERYYLWFDPSEDFHQYSILWTDSQIM